MYSSYYTLYCKSKVRKSQKVPPVSCAKFAPTACALGVNVWELRNALSWAELPSAKAKILRLALSGSENKLINYGGNGDGGGMLLVCSSVWCVGTILTTCCCHRSPLDIFLILFFLPLVVTNNPFKRVVS